MNEARAIGRRIGLRRAAVRELRGSQPARGGIVFVGQCCRRRRCVDGRRAAGGARARLTHVKRGDRRTQRSQPCAIWFNPLVWCAAASLARAWRACDDEVLRFGAKPSAGGAAAGSRAQPGSMWTPATALSMARRSAIEGRLLSILADAVRVPRRSTRWLVGFSIVAITTTILGAQNAQPSVTPRQIILAVTPAKPKPLMGPQMVMALDDKDRQTESITNALVRSLADSDRGVREQAAMGLAITPGSDVIDPLIGALKDPDAQVREKAAIGLAFRRDPKIIEPLLAAMDDSDSQQRGKRRSRSARAATRAPSPR
jgi:hypothetical protein